VDRIAPSLPAGDRQPPTFDPATGTVAVPEPVRAAYRAWWDAEIWRLGLPAELGGVPCPAALRWAAAELLLGANPVVWMYAGGPPAANVLYQHGTEEQRRLAGFMIERRWAATMVLSEPEVGSDVGAIRTRATPLDDGSWALHGTKHFITSGGHDLAENIVHLVLARPDGHGPGVRGLSLFVVPARRYDPATGEPTGPNGVRVGGVARKLGLKASATCELVFGDGDVPARGWLLGEVHDGIRQMFMVIREARMMVGVKATATQSSAYLNALALARTRVQGADLATAGDPAAPRVTVVHHPEVRRSLLEQKAYAEGMRALALYTAALGDGTPAQRGRAALLLPVVKGYCSERGYAQLVQALQIAGGAGYLEDLPFEQYLRDAKIDSVYEGTTAIQGNDLFFRQLVRDEGAALLDLGQEIIEFAKSGAGGAALARERTALATAVGHVRAIVAVMVGHLAAGQDPDPVRRRALYLVGLNTNRLLMALGDTVVGWLLLRHAAIALAALPSAGTDHAYYEGKVAAARFFASQVLDGLAAQRAIAEAVDDTAVALPEDSF
jgi:alkylation response protein AidB-like acyl-CoA dehydrogenase